MTAPRDRREPVKRYPGLTKITSARTGRVSYELRLSATVAGKRTYLYRRYPTLAAGRAAWSERQAEIRTGAYRPASRETVDQFAARWFDRQEARGAWQSSTAYHRRKDYAKHVQPALGGVRLGAVTRADCQRLIDDLVAAGRKPNAVLAIHGLLSGLFRAAERDELIARNPARGLTLPTPRPAPVPTWTGPQVAALLPAPADAPDGPLWRVVLATGVRIGEALALTWRDVDLATAVLTVRATVRQQRDGTTAVAAGTKTGPAREVPLPPETVAALTAHRERQSAVRRAAPVWDVRGFVFTDAAGRPAGYKGVAARWGRAVTRASLPAITLHGARHVVASLLVAAGADVKVVSELLGHTTVRMTLDRYAHATGAHKRAATEALRAAIHADRVETAQQSPTGTDKTPSS